MKNLVPTIVKPIVAILVIGGMLTACGAESLAPKTGDAVNEKPNILLIMAEDMSARVGYHEDKVANTPNIDKLASEGLSYMRVFTAAGVCAPSRTAFIMGAHQQTIGGHQMRTNFKNYKAVPPADVKAFPELLRAAGYYVTNNSKTDYQVGNPFTIWDESSSKAHWRNRPDGKPFFHMVTLNVTHESFTWPADTQPSDGMSEQALKTLKKVIPRNGKIREKQKGSTKPEDVVVPPYLPDTPEVRGDLTRHYNNIEQMDGQVGDILAELKADGLLEKTIVIWTTDHGDGLPRAKRTVYESGLHVPLTIRFPSGYRVGEKTDDLISFVDMGPTLLALAGAQPAEHMQGNVFLGDARNDKRNYIHAAADRHDEIEDRVRSVRNDRFKYIRNYSPEKALFQHMWYRDIQPSMRAIWKGEEEGSLNQVQAQYLKARAAEELYDLNVDPYEINNLAANPDYAKHLTELSAEMDRFQAEFGDMGAIDEDEMIEAMWPGKVQPVTAAPVITRADDGTVTITAENNASIGYKLGAEANWQLYSGSFDLESGIALKAKAVRYGYKESVVVSVK